MLTTELLARDWEQYAIENHWSDVTESMVSRYAKCIGYSDGQATFLIRGMKEDEPDAYDVLVVDEDGLSCFDVHHGFIGTFHALATKQD